MNTNFKYSYYLKKLSCIKEMHASKLVKMGETMEMMTFMEADWTA